MTTNKPEINISNYTAEIYETAVDFGDAVSLDGVNDYIDLGNPSELQITGNQTIEMWIKPGNFDSRQNPYAKAYGGEGTITMETNGSLSYYYGTTGSNSGVKDTSFQRVTTVANVLEIDKWSHIAIVRDFDSGKITWYINGQEAELIDSSIPIFNAAVAGANSAYLGDGYLNNFEGKIDEVRIWNTVRTQTEIQDNLYQKLDASEDDLVAYYNFNEDSVDDNTVSDITESGNDGTLTNGNGDNFDSSLSFKGHIDIQLDQKVTNQPGIIVNYEIESDSTATQDEDFYNSQTDVSTTDNEPQTDSIFIAEGEDSARIYLTALPDAVVEGDENIKLTLLPDFNKALDLDGFDDYVEIPHSDNLSFSNSFTLEAWINPSQIKTDWQPLLTKQNSTGGERNYGLYIRPNETKVHYSVFGADGTHYSINSTGDLELNEWNHITLVVDNGVMRLYLNGVEDASSPVNVSTSLFQNTEPVKIGKEINSFTAFEGQIDEVRIWDTARTETEIQDTLYATLKGDEANLVGYYNFDDDSVDGNVISDVSSNEALSFDGSNDYVSVGSNDSLDLSGGQFTLEAWIYPTINDNSYHAFLGYQAGSGSTRVRQRYPGMWVVNQTSIHFGFGDGSDWNKTTVANAITNNAWNHVATTFDGTNYRLLVNGEEIYSGTFAQGKTPYPNKQFEIGRVFDNGFPGKIDEVRIWNIARTETEIQSTLNSSLSGNENNLVAYYNFENGAATDSTSNNNNGTINGATAVENDNQDFLNNGGTLVTGNKALSLDGIDDEISISDTLDTDSTNKFTIETWFKSTATSGTLMGAKNNGGDYWRVYLEGGSAKFDFRNSSGDSTTPASSTQVNDGNWHHIAVVRTSNRTGTLYIDGQSVSSIIYSGSSSAIDITTDIFIGRYADGSDYFAGEIDEVRVWNEALSSTQIEANYLSASVDANASNLTAYYTFDNGNANDSANSNNGTVNGASFVDSGIFTDSSFTDSLVYDPFATNGATYSIQSNQSADITIKDSDDYVVDIVVANKFGEDLSDAANYVVVDDSGDATFQVKLTSQPTEDVTVSVSINSTTNNLTFTSSNWDAYQTLTVSNLNISTGTDANNTVPNTVNINGGTYTNQTKQLSVIAFNYDYFTILELTEGGAELELTPTVSISSTTSPEATEGNETESGVFTVRLDTPAPEGGLVIPFSVSSTATEGTDYNLYSDSLAYKDTGLSLDGVDDYVSIPDSDDIDFDTNDNFTVETWVRADSNQADLNNTDNDIIEKWDGTGSGYPFVIRYSNTSGKIVAGRYDGSSSRNNPSIASNTSINDGGFHHIAFVKNGSTLSLYIDGNLEGTSTDTTTSSTKNNSPLHIGNRATKNYFKGEVDELRIWETARTEAEIQANLYNRLSGTEEGLAAYYNFDNATTTVPDLTDNGNDGTPYIGQSLSLDGVNDYVEIPNANELEFGTESFTVEAWVYDDPNSTDWWNNAVSKKEAGNTSNGTDSGWTLRINRDDQPQFFLADGTNRVDANSNTVLTEGEWYHLAGVVDRNTGEAYLYVNGELQSEATQSITGLGSVNSGNSLKIGNWDNLSSSSFWHGKVDEVRIWDTARTEAEIQENLDKKLAGTEDNLVAYYNFNDDSGTTITDSTNNSNNGTLNNGNANNLVSSAIGYTSDWEADKPVVKFAEGETEATITVSKIDNEIVETAGETVTVTLQDWYNYDLNTSQQSAFVTLNNDDEGGIEFAKLDTVGGIDNIAQEFIVSTAYDATTGQVGLTLNNGSKNYTLDVGAELTFDGGAIVTVDSQTTIAATGETLFNVTFTQDSATNEINSDEISEIELVNIELSSFATNDTDAIAIFDVSLAQAPTEEVTLTLTDANGTATATVIFTTSNWDTAQSVRMIVEEDSSDSSFDVRVSTTTTNQQDDNYGDRTFDVPISTETVATSLEFYDNTVVTSEVATIELEVTSDYASGNVGLKIASGEDSYILTAGTQLSFSDGAVVTVDSDTTISTDDAGISVAVTFTAESSNSAITSNETTEIELPGADSTKFAVRLTSKPTDNVDVTLNINDSTEGQFVNGTSTDSLSFTTDNWNTYQEVTLYGVDDAEDDGNVNYSITTTATNTNDSNYDNFSGDSISVSNQDNDETTKSVDDTSNSSNIVASLSTVTSEVTEGSTGQGLLKVTLSEAAPTGGLKVRYAVSGGTATPDEDFVDLQGFVERTGDENLLSESQIGLVSNIEDELLDFKLVDLDNDTDLDAVVLRFSEESLEEVNYLENIGDSTFSNFEQRIGTNNPFDGLFYDKIAFGDLNGDGNSDALVVDFLKDTYYLENTTTENGTPSFATAVDLSLNLGFSVVFHNLVDIDNDGSLELFVGLSDGTISYYENTTTGTTPSFTLQTANNPFNGVDVGFSAAPNFIDYDSDGDFDVFIGKRGGIGYYENTGSADNPQFTERTGDANPTNSLTIDNLSNYPYLVDIDNDGDIDLFNAEGQGQNIRFYEDTFFQEVEIAAGATEATIDINTIADNIAENDETIEVSLSAKPSQTYSLTVTQDYSDVSGSLGSIGLQINGTEAELVGIPSGTELTFSNGSVFKVDSPVNLSNQTSGIVEGALISGTNIVSGETTDFADEGYRLFGNLKVATEFIGGVAGVVGLQLDETNLSSLTLEDGTELTFSGGEVVKVVGDTTINNSSSTSVQVESADENTTPVITVNETTSSPVNLSSTVTIVDDDVAGITISGSTDGSTPLTTLEIDAGDDNTPPTVKTFDVVLDTKPTGNVAVYVGSNNSEEGLLSDDDETTEDVVKLVFTPDNWDTQQTVSLTPVDDVIDDGDINYELITTVISDDIFYQEDLVTFKIENSFDSSTDNSISLQVDDLSINKTNLAAGTQLSFGNGAVFTVDADTSVYNSKYSDVNLTLDTIASQIDVGTTVTTTDFNGNTVELIVDSYDAENGTIGLKSNEDSSVSVNEDTPMYFSNGATGVFSSLFRTQTFLISLAREVDFNLQGYTVTDESFQFQESISSDISVTNIDDDNAGVTVDTYDISSLEGYGNNFFNVKLNTKPVGEVTVTMNPVDASGDKDYNISLANEFDGESYSITFDEDNWNFAQAVKVTAVDDYDIEYNHTSYIDFQVSSDEDSNYNTTVTPPDDIIVKIEDNDLPNASIKAVAAATEAGSPGYFVVTLDNPAPNGFDGTGIVVNYSVSGTVDIDDTNGETNDLKPLTGSVRIAPGESRSPIIAFPIDDFKVESIPLVVTGFNSGTNTVTLEINTANLSESQLESLIEVGTVTLDDDTEITFSDGAIANVLSTSGTLQIDSSGSVSSITANVEFTSDITTVAIDETTSIPKEAVVVTLSSGSDYSINANKPPSATLSIQDNDKPGVRVVEIGDTTVVNENGTAEFYISLLSQPESDVTISLAGVSTDRKITVEQAYSSGGNTIQLKVDDSQVNSLLLPAGIYTLGNASVTVSSDTTIFSDKSTEVPINSISSGISAGESFTYSYTELGFDNTYTFTSDNWYKLQAVTVKGLDDAVAETGDTHTSSIQYSFNTTDSIYQNLEVPPQTINIIDRTFDAENTAESLIEGFFALQDGLDSVSIPIVGSLDGVAPSFIEDFIGDLVDEIKQTEYVTAQSLQDTFNNVLSGRFGVVNVEITDLSTDNIEFLLGVEDSFTESISINGDLGLPALGIEIESDGSLDANFDYAIDLAFGINTDDGFYVNTEDTGFDVAASFGLSDNFSATGNLGFLQLDVANGDDVGGTNIDAEFVISLEDNNDSNGDNSQLTLSELNDLRKSDNLFDSIKYGFSGDAALDLDVITSVEGNTGFPSFSFNLSSELPLFNYSNSGDEEEVSGATLTVSNTINSTEGSSITLDVISDDDTNIIQINKGTELTFGDSSVVLTKTAYIQTGTAATTIYATVADDGDNNQTESVTIASGAEAELVSGNFNLTFSDITLDLGGFVTDLMSPIISYVNELIEPFEPIIDVLQTEIELLETLKVVDLFDENDDGSATLIEVASTLATTFGAGNLKYQKFFDAVTGIIDLVDTINDLEDSISGDNNLGVDYGDYTLENFAAAADDEDASDIDTSDTANSTNNLNSNVKNNAKNTGSSGVKTKVKNFFSKLDDLGIVIPLLEDPLTAINLFLGQDIDLVTYDIPELDVEFSVRQEFPIFGTIKGLLEGGFSLYSDLVVGFDTYGLSQWEEADFDLAESYKILDGFYLSDIDPETGEDVDELTLDATIAAGVSASAVVAKAELTGGVTGTAGLDIIDVGEFTGTSDGKLRGSEVLAADSLFDLFSLSGSLDAFVKALVKVGIDLGFYEIMTTVWEEEFSITLFEFELGGSSGTVSQSYIEGAKVFFDANLNGIYEEGEPITTSNADGSYNLEVPLLFFDTNDNGKIDPEEGRIVTEGGKDTSSGIEIETPLIAPYGAKMVTPLTTLKQKLIEDGSTPEEAEQLVKESLDLPDINLEEFDALDAMSKGDERGTKVYKAHVQIQSLFAQTSEFMKGLGEEELEDKKRPIPEQAIDAIAKGLKQRKGKPPINFSDSAELEELIKEPLEGKFKSKAERPQRLPESFGILTKTMASGNKEIDEVFKGVPPQDILGKVAPVKKVTQEQLPKELRKLVGGARREDITSLLERVPDAEQFLIDKQSQPGDKPPVNGGEQPDDKNPLPVVDSEDDTIILPNKPRKLLKGKRPRNLLELDGDDLTDTKIKFSLSSKNLPAGRIHEIAIFTTEDEEGTINGISPEDGGYKEAALSKARSIFSILPDDFIANPKRIMKGFANQNIGFLLIKNGTVDSARRGRTSYDSVLLGSEAQGESFQRMQLTERGENSFRLSFEDGIDDADFTDIVIDAELTDETPEIGTDTQGESEGEMLDFREYEGKQIQIQAPIVREESAYENVVGFYVVEDENGAVIDPLTGNVINPGEEGYTKAALRNSQNNAFQMGEKGIGGNKQIKGGQIFAPFAIANGTLEEILDDNPNNDPEVFFAHIAANSDGVDHIRNLGGNTWGVEDLVGGGDMDYNDIVFKLDVTVG